MRMHGRSSRIEEIIENHIHAWSRISAFLPLAEILKRDKDFLIEKFWDSRTGESPSGDSIRSGLLCHALEQNRARIDTDHFVLFKEAETVQAVLEDSFGMVPGMEFDLVVLPYQNQVFRILIKSVLGKRPQQADSKDILVFLNLFSRMGRKEKSDQDRIMRYKTMVWMAYLAIELIRIDQSLCEGTPDVAAAKLRRLYENVIDGKIIDENSRRPGFEDGKWEKTLFGWLQGDDTKAFVMKLKKQFNFENKMEHANRFLLAEHRKAIIEETLRLFC